jgi:hypothetical protein
MSHSDADDEVSVPIEYWFGKDSVQGRDESFWTKDAMERAIGAYWYRVHQEAHGPEIPMPSLLVTIDRERGVVVVSAAEPYVPLAKVG